MGKIFGEFPPRRGDFADFGKFFAEAAPARGGEGEVINIKKIIENITKIKKFFRAVGEISCFCFNGE